MSRNRIQRPSASSRRRWTWPIVRRARRQHEQLAGHLELDRERRSPESSTTMRLPRRPPPRSPALALGDGRRGLRVRPNAAPRSSRRRRVQVARDVSSSGSSGARCARLIVAPTTPGGAGSRAAVSDLRELGRIGARPTAQRAAREDGAIGSQSSPNFTSTLSGTSSGSAAAIVSRRSGTSRAPRHGGPPGAARRGPGEARDRKPSARSRRSTRIMAIFMMSAAVPWIGMLIAIRSPAPRRLGFEARSSGISRFRPSRVVT